MRNARVHLATYETMADSEVGHLLVELNTGRFTGVAHDIVSVGESLTPITTMGGLQVVPDVTIEDVDPGESDLLILPGAALWDDGGGARFAEEAKRFLDSGVPVAAICGATAGLARCGLLDIRRHTSASVEYLTATNYRGAGLYVEARAVIDGDVITAGPQSPVQFARAVCERLTLAPPSVLEAYEALFDRGDQAAFAVLMEHAA